jgi:hypothetical protein
MRRLKMKFSAPSVLVFVISLVIAGVAALTAMGSVAFIPLASVWIMAIAYAVLAAGCIFKGV